MTVTRISERETSMTPDERNLLLTTARVLRAIIKESIFDPSGNNKDDFEQMKDALTPFDCTHAEPVNEHKG